MDSLIEREPELMNLREQYADKSAEARRKAAEWVYGEAITAEVTAPWFGGGEEFDVESHLLRVLAIDPEYGPALLSVGSVQHQLGRVELAMELFMRLLELPADTEDLCELVDQAGTFLLEAGDLEHATRLFATAVECYPREAVYASGLGYCYGRAGDTGKSVEYARRADDLDPHNHVYLGDLGWALLQDGQFAEAETVLLRAVALSPPNEERAQANLEYLYTRWEKQDRDGPASQPRVISPPD